MNVGTVQLGELATVIGGYSFKSKDFVDQQGVPVVKIANITRDGVDLSDSLFLPDEFLSIKDKFHVNNGDVLISLTGSQLSQPNSVVGRVARYSYEITALLNQRVGKLIPNDQRKCDIRFIYYFLKQDAVTYQLAVNAKGSANQANISGTDVERLRIPAFSIVQQHCIASILSAYDDLIENNRRRIQLLEQAARLLYKEWFVHLRFPGHEHVKIKDGVPEGWGKKTAFDVMEVLSGGTPKTDVADNWDGDIPFFTPKDAADSAYVFATEKTLTDSGLKNCNSKLYPKDTVFITARGTVGNINLAQTAMAMNQSCYALVAKPQINQYYLYFALVDGVEQFRSRAVGAVFDAIIRDTFKQIPFVVPDRKIIQTFTDHATPILRQIDVLTTETRKMTQARDLLLPRLMNGEVAV